MTDIGNLLIIGDSYSTFEGSIPKEYDTWYSNALKPETDVTKVEQTWWYLLLQKVHANLLLNSSWSGTTICNTGYEGADFSDKSFITRLDQLIEKKYFEKNHVDTLFVFGGTNDSWADAPLGELKYSDWTQDDLYCVLPAIGYLFYRITTKLVGVRAICIINTELKQEIHAALTAACEKYGIETIELQDIAKEYGHPNILGMSQIEAQVEEYLNRTRR